MALLERVEVALLVPVRVRVAVTLDVIVTVDVGVRVMVQEDVRVGELVAVRVIVHVDVGVAVRVRLRVLEYEEVAVRERDRVDVDVRDCASTLIVNPTQNRKRRRRSILVLPAKKSLCAQSKRVGFAGFTDRTFFA